VGSYLRPKRPLSMCTRSCPSGIGARLPGISARMTLPRFSSCCRGQRIENVTDLLAGLRKKDPGDQAEVAVQRGQDTKTATVTLAIPR
jgi:hypothetical protein